MQPAARLDGVGAGGKAAADPALQGGRRGRGRRGGPEHQGRGAGGVAAAGVGGAPRQRKLVAASNKAENIFTQTVPKWKHIHSDSFLTVTAQPAAVQEVYYGFFSDKIVQSYGDPGTV